MFEIDESSNTLLNADIRVIGVGGGGGNAIETMIKEGVRGVKFITVNTDAQALSSSSAETKIQLGAKLTKGLGAGANPEIGRRAAIESYEEIITQLKGADMVFITAGMGGGTGTGGIPVLAEAARELGALTVGVVTTPFLFEGNKRRKRAEKGITELKKHLDTLIVIPNEKLLSLFDDDTPLLETFKKTDDVLLRAVKGLAELISLKGLINLDFADVKTVMTDKGMALMGVGVGSGKNRAIQAVEGAISSPLLGDVSIHGATGVIVNITSGTGLSLKEVNAVSSLITKAVDSEADIIVGAVIDENIADRLSVSIIATGFNEEFQTPPLQAFSLENRERKSVSSEEKPSVAGNFKETVASRIDIEHSAMGESKINPTEESDPSLTRLEFSRTKTSPETQFANQHKRRQTRQQTHQEFDKELSPTETPSAEQTNNLEVSLREKNDSSMSESSSEKTNEQPLKETDVKEQTSPSTMKAKNSSVRDMLLKKAREYASQKTEEPSQTKSVFPQQQMAMNWPEDSLNEEDSANTLSPFEKDLNFSEEDLR
ncbi:MAG: cell division protein FtsZ [Bdellovibrionales bacterium]|nr:cell division protein FtsZ [Bdellovibrionales bacterium]